MLCGGIGGGGNGGFAGQRFGDGDLTRADGEGGDGAGVVKGEMAGGAADAAADVEDARFGGEGGEGEEEGYEA